MNKFRTLVDANEGSITAAIYDAGYNSSSRFYETATQAFGMTRSRLRKGVQILFAIGECSLGSVLMAGSAKGVCAMLLGGTPKTGFDLPLDIQGTTLPSAFRATVSCDLTADCRATGGELKKNAAY